MSEAQTAKIGITINADTLLTKCLEKVNEDFLGGRVTKASLASWLIIEGSKNLTQKNIESLQRAEIKPVNYLEALAKKLRSAGKETLTEDEINELNKILGRDNLKGKRAPHSKQEENQASMVLEREIA